MQWLRMSTLGVATQTLVELKIYQRALQSPSQCYRLEVIPVYGVVDDSSMILMQLPRERM